MGFGVWLMTSQPTLLPALVAQSLVVILPFLSLFGMFTEMSDDTNDIDDAPTKWAKAKYRKVRNRKKKVGG